MNDLNDFSAALDGHVSGSGWQESMTNVFCTCGHTWTVAVVREFGSVFVKDEDDMQCEACGKMGKFKKEG